MKPVYERKPERFPFLFYTIFKRLIVVCVLAGIISFFTLWAWPVAGLLAVLMIIWRGARYRKEHYQFFEDRIVVRSGSLFSDNKTELVLGRVTHVTHRLPWIENNLFGTGHVHIQSAGSSGTEASLLSIAGSDEVYQYVERVLQSNGFSLSKKKLLVEASPNPVAVVLDILKMYIFFFFFLIALAGPFLIGALLDVPSDNGKFVLAGFFLVLLFILASSVLRYLDLSRRRYRVYSDTVTYEEGFLSKVYSFLPAENLSDSATTQSFIGRLLGLYDVTISVQGAGGETRFSNLREGKEVDSAIDQVIDTHKGAVTGSVKQSAKTSHAKPAARKEQKVRATIEGEFKPLLLRCAVPAILALPLIVFPPAYFIFAAVFIIRHFAESYTVKDGRILYEYNFLRTRRVEFTADKITEVEFHKGIIDRFTDTITVKVKSIGSGQNITLFGVPDTPQLRQSVLSVDNVEESPAITEYPSRYSVWSGLLEIGPVLWLFFFLCVGFSVFFGYTGRFVLAWILVFAFLLVVFAFLIGFSLRYRNALLSVHGEYVRYEYGWIGRITHFARYDAVKSVDTRQYWHSTSGAVEIDIAGEEQLDSSRSKQNVPRPQRFTARFIPDAFSVHDDLLVRCGAQAHPKELLRARPLARNSLPIYIVLLPLIIFYPFVLWSFSKRSYRLFGDRAEYFRGIFSRRRKTILYFMVDHVRSGQGLLNKLFGNGRVSIYTTGSSTAEMSLGPVKEYEQVARTLEEHYS